MTLVYANRTHRTVMFLDEVHDLKDRFPDRFQLVHVLSREQQDVELFSGRLDGDRLTRILDALLPADDVDEWFLCGPQQMVVDLREVILDHGVDADTRSTPSCSTPTRCRARPRSRLAGAPRARRT